MFNRSNNFIQVIAIRGETYADCRLHYEKSVKKSINDPVLVIVRDRDNIMQTPMEFKKYYETDSKQGLVFLDYQRLLYSCRTATNIENLRGCLNEFFPEERRII